MAAVSRAFFAAAAPMLRASYRKIRPVETNCRFLRDSVAVGITTSAAVAASCAGIAYCYRRNSRAGSNDNHWSFPAVLASTVAAGATSITTQCNGSNSSLIAGRNHETDSVLVPTLEASFRAMRLVTTALLIVIDYELAKREAYLPFTLQRKEETEMEVLEKTVERRELAKREAYLPFTLQRKEETEMEVLEKTVERREQEFEAAQKEYATGVPAKGLTAAERGKKKREQKEKMRETAARLAEAEEEIRSKEGVSAKSRLHRKEAERLLRLCRQNGGVYIKVGQHLANLDYILPPEYIEIMSSLFDDAPESTYEDVCTVIEEDLGGPVNSFFDDFDPVPIASASLAQVHVAYDKKTKRKLAVKVQHRGLRETSRGDIYVVTTVVRLIDRYFKDFAFGWIADEIAPQLPLELDFVREGKNAERAQANLKGSGLQCCIPNILWEGTTSRVLTMEFEEGFKATDSDALEKSGLDKSDVAKLVSSVFNSQVFESGFVHVDPHPANCLLRAKNGKPEMVLVDHGLYKDIDDDFRLKYAELWRSLMLADLKGIENACAALGVKRAYPLFAAMLTARPYDEIIERSKANSWWSFTAPSNVSPESQADRAVIAGYAKMFMTQIFALLGDLPRDMLLLLKMNDCLRHIDYALGSPTNTLVVAGKYASKVIYKHQIQGRGLSIADRIRCWMEYMKVLFRIQLHDIGTWVLQR